MIYAFFVFMIALFVIGLIVAGVEAERRRKDMAKLANKLGLQFQSESSHELYKQVEFIDALRQGNDRYAFNVITGNYKSHDITTFDFHYSTQPSKQTHHHFFSFFILNLPRSFPELIISEEGFFSKIAETVGFDDIDFESKAFSDHFCVRSKDKKFAYDIVTPQLMEYLLANRDLTIEIEKDVLAISFSKRLRVENIQHNLDRLLKIRSFFPQFLMEQ